MPLHRPSCPPSPLQRLALATLASLALAACDRAPPPAAHAAPPVTAAAAQPAPTPVAAAPASPPAAAQQNLAGVDSGAFVQGHEPGSRDWFGLLNAFTGDTLGYTRNGSRDEIVVALAQSSTLDLLRFRGLDEALARHNPTRVEVAAADQASGPWKTVLQQALPAQQAGFKAEFKLDPPVQARFLRLQLQNDNPPGEAQIGLGQFMAYGSVPAEPPPARQIGGTLRFPIGFGASGFVVLQQSGAAVQGCVLDAQRGDDGRLHIAAIEGTLAGGIEAGGQLRFTTTATDGTTRRGIMSFSPDGSQVYAALFRGDAVEEAAGSRVPLGAQPQCAPSAEADDNALSQPLEAAGRVSLYGINFDLDASTLRPDARPAIAQIVALARKHADWRFTIEGHTDASGSEAHNQKLSEDRATAVVEALKTAGVDAARLRPQGFGATKPVAPNDSPAGRATNRRVELVRQ
ncbi:OmpA family protein [Xylophilus sp. GW821-FHT01B05]